MPSRMAHSMGKLQALRQVPELTEPGNQESCTIDCECLGSLPFLSSSQIKTAQGRQFRKCSSFTDLDEHHGKQKWMRNDCACTGCRRKTGGTPCSQSGYAHTRALSKGGKRGFKFSQVLFSTPEH
jgi:hypothetical protein